MKKSRKVLCHFLRFCGEYSEFTMLLNVQYRYENVFVFTLQYRTVMYSTVRPRNQELFVRRKNEAIGIVSLLGFGRLM
jgi:hypothetical protein